MGPKANFYNRPPANFRHLYLLKAPGPEALPTPSYVTALSFSFWDSTAKHNENISHYNQCLTFCTRDGYHACYRNTKYSLVVRAIGHSSDSRLTKANMLYGLICSLMLIIQRDNSLTCRLYSWSDMKPWGPLDRRFTDFFLITTWEKS